MPDMLDLEIEVRRHLRAQDFDWFKPYSVPMALHSLLRVKHTFWEDNDGAWSRNGYDTDGGFFGWALRGQIIVYEPLNQRVWLVPAPDVAVLIDDHI